MPEIETPVPTDAVAEHLKLAPSTLERWRRDGKGPPYMRIGNRCMYFLSEVQKWMEDQVVDPTPKKAKPQGGSLFGN